MCSVEPYSLRQSENLKYLVPTLTCKLFILPAIIIAIAYTFGLRGLELFLLIAVYATPVAAASYPMAQNMGGDGGACRTVCRDQYGGVHVYTVLMDLLYEIRGTDLNQIKPCLLNETKFIRRGAFYFVFFLSIQSF